MIFPRAISIHKFKLGFFGILILLFASIVPKSVDAQEFHLTYGSNAATLAETITGNGVQILNAQLTCADSAYGTYDIIGIPDFPHGPGVVLSTGNIKNVKGPNISQTTTTEWGTPGDQLLSTISGHQSYDACTLEFDVVPVGDTLRFNFTFASEEYNEYVGTPFNDAFGFFISGPGISGDPGLNGQENIALIPGTSQPVEINSVNNGNPDIGYPPVNPQYFVNNPLSFSNPMQYDGWTKNVFAQKVVHPCDTFHLKLVIADIADKKWDSSVFIEKIESNNVSLSSFTAGGIENMVEGCNDGTVTFTREPVTAQPLIVTYFIDGTAINGTDYPLIGGDPNPNNPKFITIPANQAEVSIVISPIGDGLSEGSETVKIYVGNPLCAGTVQDSLIFIIQDSLDVSITPPLSFVCLGDSLVLNAESSATNFSWSPTDYLNDPTLLNPTSTPTSNIIYTLSASAAGCTSIATTEIHVTNVQLSAVPTQILCGGSNSGAIDLNINGGQSPIEINWVGPNGFISSSEDISNLAPGTYIVLVTDRDGCTAETTVQITELPPLTANLSSPVFTGGDNISCFQGSDGQINSSISGGTAPFTFEWNDPSGQTSQTATGLMTGTYTLIVTDANLCQSTDSITITEPELVTADLLERINVLCNGDNSGLATIEAAGGHPAYSYLWNTLPPQSGATVSNLSAGFYTVTITDINGCTGNLEVEIEQPDAPISGSLVTTNILCNGDSTGSATASIQGGTPPYIYSWSSDANETDSVITDLPAGNYALTVKDANGCTFVIPFNISQPPPISISILSQSNVLCAGSNTGSITANASGGAGSYTYTWNTDPVSTGTTINNLGAGTYTVEVSDLNGCTKSLDVAITEPDSLDIIVIVQTNPTCAESSDGALEVAATGGTEPYTYSWNTVPLTAGPALSGKGAGTYEVNVTDTNGCSSTLSIDLIAPDPIIITKESSQNVLCNGASTGAATVSVTGGTPDYTYSWNDPLNQTTASASNLPAGDYTVTVTDGNGCTAQLNISITEPEFPLGVSLVSSNDVMCFGDSSGSATVIGTGGSGSYSYLWDDANTQQTATANNLVAGTYNVTVTDNNGCDTPVILEVIITEPASILAITLTPSSFLGGVNVVCAEDSTATIDLEITGGIAPYSILWDLPGLDTSTDEDLSNLAPGTYSVTVTDDNGCEQTQSITLVAPTPIEITYQMTPSLCFGSPTGTIELQISGGIPDYTVLWNGPGGFTSSDLSLNTLEGGIYYLSITDSNGCVYLDAVTVTQPEDLIIQVDSLSDYNGFNTSCWNSSDGAIYITPSGGTEPYSYQWNTAGDPNFSNQQDIMNQMAGTYEAVLFDANGCIQNQFIDLTAPDTLDVDFNLSLFNSGFNISCNGESDGSIEAIPSGGTPDYSFLWIGSNGYGPVSANPIEDLSAGEYSVLVSDANGCSYSESITLIQPAPFSISLATNTINGNNISCNGAEDGTINLSITGGAQPLIIVWTGPDGFTSSDEDLFNLPAGEYCVDVTDANDCIQSQCITLTEPEPITIVLSPSLYGNGLNLNCDDSADGIITTNVTGGTSPLTYSWSGPSNFTSSATDIFVLNEGNYCLTISDANGCQETSCITLFAPDPIEIVLDSLTSPACNAGNTASIEVTIEGGDPAFTYNWTGPGGFNASTEDIFNLGPGEYCLYITDANNCTAERCFSITAPPALELSVSTSSFAGGYQIDCNGNMSGTATGAATGGTAPYSFEWSGPGGFTSTESFIDNLAPGTYCLEVTDANACVINDCVTITEPVELTLNPTILLPTCSDGNPATIDLNVSGGVAPYTFNWNSGDNTETVQVGQGDYTVIVSDANGCSTTQDFNILFPSTIDVIPTSPVYGGGYNLVCNGDNSGTISIEVYGGFGNLSASWTGPSGFTSTDANLTNLEAGEYCITVMDDLGCSGDTCITLTAPQPLGLTANTQNVSCFDGQNGSISATVSGGVPTYSISWNGPDGFIGSGTELSGLKAGNYCATVTDFNNCTSVICFDVLQPSLLNLDLSSPELNGYNIGCYGANTGQIDAVITGGTAPFSYQWTGSGGYASSDENLINLFVGEYCLTITDANGCSGQSCITLNQAPGIDISISKFEYPNGFNVSCGSACDGSLTASISGGAAPVEASWVGPNGFNSDQLDLTDLCAGTYILSLTDANGCSQDTSISITKPQTLLIALNSPVYLGGNNVACYGTNTGAIDALISGGIAPYTLAWTGPDGFIADTTHLESLAAGAYSVTVTDQFNCTTNASIELTQPDEALTATSDPFLFPSGTNISCKGADDGSISANSLGGTAPYSYNWNGPDNYTSTDQNITGLAPGDYTLIVEDANSCVFTINTTLNEPVESLSSDFTVESEIICAGDSSGSLSVIASGGSPDYSITWTGPDGFTSDVFSISDLAPGTYSYTVEDLNGCSSTGSYAFVAPPAISISADITDANCQTSTGIINISVSNGTAPYTYLWTGGNDTQDLINVPSGNYTVDVTDDNGCSVSQSFEIGSFNSLEIEANITHLLCNGDKSGMIDVMVTQGAEPYSFTWSGPNGFAENGTPILNLNPGEYTVTANDASGCEVTETYEVTEPAVLDIAALISPEYPNGYNLSAFQSGDGVITTPQVTGGTAPYTFDWSSDNGYTSTSGNNQLNLQAGTYMLQVTDANMCTDTASITLVEPIPLEIPNGISPNGDGFNDFFSVRGLDNYPENKLLVFNRWGNQVYEESNYRNSNPWYGTNADGEELPEGTYFVVMELTGADNLKGYLEIRR